MAIRLSAVPEISGSFSLTVSTVAANSILVETHTVKGLTPEMLVAVQSPTLNAGLLIVQERITAADTVEFSIWNVTGVDVTPGLKTFLIATL